MNRAFPALIALFFLPGCSSTDKSEVEESGTSIQAAVFHALADSIPPDTLPYVLNEIQYIRYTDFKEVPDTLAARLLGSAENGARYYIVSKPIVADSFTALVILESTVDTNFTTHEQFQLVSYDDNGTIIGRCDIGEARYEQHFFQSIGSLSTSAENTWKVVVETYMSELVDGEWRQISFPVEVNQYSIDGRGGIKHVKTTTNSLDNPPVDVS